MRLAILLAEVSPLEIGGFALTLFALVAGVNQVMKFLDRFKEQPPPHQTYQVKGDYVTQREWRDLSEKVDDLAAELRESIAEVRREKAHDREVMGAAAEARAEKIQNRISELMVLLTRIEMSRPTRK